MLEKFKSKVTKEMISSTAENAKNKLEEFWKDDQNRTKVYIAVAIVYTIIVMKIGSNKTAIDIDITLGGDLK